MQAADPSEPTRDREMSPELPLAGSAHRAWDRQRTVASRNEQAILDAAGDLLGRHGTDAVDVRQIAEAAGVGVGTVYRRFGDKASVIAALIGDQERRLQDDVLSGPPPLGPGAPAPERLEAFLRALCALTECNLDLLYASESAAAGGRQAIGAYQAWHQHTAILLRGLDPLRDADWHADLLLAPLGAALYRHHRRALGLGAADIADRLSAAAHRLSRPDGLTGRA